MTPPREPPTCEYCGGVLTIRSPRIDQLESELAAAHQRIAELEEELRTLQEETR
jgi:hypothetical protein